MDTAAKTAAEASRRLVEQTRRLYAQVLPNRPLLDERQLARPTFRFIQELVKALIKETRILRDVFRAQDFDGAAAAGATARRFREQFVQRLIEFAAANGAPVAQCVAARVVSGLEPNKTLELLQALARVAQQRMASSLAKRPRTFTKTTPAPSSAGAAEGQRGPPERSPAEEPQSVEPQPAASNAAAEVKQPPRPAQQASRPAAAAAKASSEADIARSGLQLRQSLRSLRQDMELLVSRDEALRAALVAASGQPPN